MSELQAWIEKVSSMTSDEFGHNTQALLEAESQVLQEMASRFISYIEAYDALTEQLKVCEAERDKANEACRVLEELTGANNQRNRWLGVAAATALLVSERDQLLEQVKVLREALEKVKGEK